MAASAKGKGGHAEPGKAAFRRTGPPGGNRRSRRALLSEFNTSSWEKAT